MSKVQKKKRISPFKEVNLVKEFKKNFQNISVSNNFNDIEDGSYVFLALPTDYDVNLQSFNTKTLDNAIEWLSRNRPKSIIIIKSTMQ